jgi:hypothetical protein
VDDQQGPWWTRPPEPGQTAPPLQRRRTSGQQDVDLEYPPSEADDGGVDIRGSNPGSDLGSDEQPTAAYSSTFATDARTEFLPNGYPVDAPPEPETEPAPPAPPVIRRVAVVEPTRPAVPNYDRGSSEDRTETLPVVPSDIFATFSGPTSGYDGGPAAPPPAGPPGPPDPAAPERPSLQRLAQLAQTNLPEPRILLLAGAGLLVVLLIVVVALVTGGSPKSAPTTQPPASTAPGGAKATVLKGKKPDGLKQVGNDVAAAQLRQAGATAGGTIIEAWGWKDVNGQNLVVTSISTNGAKRTLKVTHLARLEGDPRTLRVMRDPNLPSGCSGGGTAGFTPKALHVVDLNGDNVAEVVSGWSSRCGGAGTSSQIRLALITNGKKYIIRGQGVVGDAKSGSFTADPKAKNWPPGFLKALTAEYRNLYG